MNRFHAVLVAHGFHRDPFSSQHYHLADEGRVSVCVMDDDEPGAADAGACFWIETRRQDKAVEMAYQGKAQEPEEIPALFEKTIAALNDTRQLVSNPY